MIGEVGHKLEQARRECDRHARILADDLREHADRAYTAEDVFSISNEGLRLLDQMAYRFGKLQSALGERVLPLVLDELEEPFADAVPFAQKLQRLERLEVIPSAEQWRQLRQIRNSIAHEYPDAPELRAASLNRFIVGVGTLLSFWRTVLESLERLDGP